MKFAYCFLYYSSKRVLVNFEDVDYIEEFEDEKDPTKKKTRIYFSYENYIFIEVKESIWKIGELL